MVLEDSSMPAEANSFEDNAPEDDTRPTEYHVDTSSFPKPIPVLGSLMGYNEAFLTKVITSRVGSCQTLMKRPVTQPELEAFSYWSAKQVSIISYGTPIGVVGGAYRAYSTMGTWKFPFYQPSAEKSWDHFPSQRFALFQGPRAALMWHAVRASLYVLVGSEFAKIIFASYSMSVVTVGELADPRLKEYREKIASRPKKQGAGRKSPIGAQVPSQQSQGREGAGAVTMRNQSYDDASPTGGSFGEEVASYRSADTIPLSDESIQRQEERASRWSQTETQAQATRPLPPLQAEEQERSFLDFDDASPTGGQGMSNQTSQQQMPQQQGGSAWDRIRNSAKSGSNQKQGSWQPKAAEQREEGGQNAWTRYQSRESMEGGLDSGSYSKSEEERNLAKAQAQAEFDAQVERERQGGEFNAPSSSYRRG